MPIKMTKNIVGSKYPVIGTTLMLARYLSESLSERAAP